MKDGLFNPFFTGNYANPYSYSGGDTPDTPILAIASIPSARVPEGTDFASINFSDYNLDEVLAIGDDSEIVTCSITWAVGSYDGDVADTYTLNGTLVPPSGYDNSNNIVPQISVEVLAIPAGYTSILNRGTVLTATLPTPICQGEEIRKYNSISASLATMDAYWNVMTDGDRAYAKINWKDPGTNDLTEVGTLTYTPRQGFTGDGTTGYLDPGAGMVLSGLTNYTLNSAGFGGYLYSEDTAGGNIAGAVNSGARFLWSAANRAHFYEINGNTNPFINDSLHRGWYHVYKTAAGTINTSKNSEALATGVSDAAVARPTIRPYILARNNNGTADSFSNATISCFWIGAPLDASLETIADAYQTFVRFIRVKPTYGAIEAIGQKITDNFARAAIGNNYTASGGTWTCDGAKLVATNGVNNFSTRLLYKYGSSSEKNIISCTVQAGQVPSSTTHGLGIGYADFNSGVGERSIIAQLSFTNLASGGKIIIHTWDGTSDVQVATSAAQFTISQNDVFVFTFEKSISGDQYLYTATATRVSDSAVVSATYSTLIGNSTSDPAIFSLQTAANNITNFSYTENDEKNHKVGIIGDSLSHGVAATGLSLGWSRLVTDDYVVSAGSGDQTNDVLGVSNSGVYGKMKNILELNCKYYLLAIGGNDVAAGNFTSAAGQKYLKVIANTILNEGHNVIFVTPPPRSADLSGITTFTEANFTGNLTIDEGWTACKNGTALAAAYDSGDEVHMNNLGHSTFAEAVAGALPTLY